LESHDPWFHFEAWRDDVTRVLRGAANSIDPLKLAPEKELFENIDKGIKDIRSEVPKLNEIKFDDSNSPTTLKDEISKLQAAIDKLQLNLDKLDTNQSLLDTALKSAEKTLKQLQVKFTDLIAGLSITYGAGPFTVPDALRLDKNDQLETYNLTAENLLAPPAKVFSAASPSDPITGIIAKVDLTTAPTLVPVATVTVQFITPPRFEVSAGVLYPFQPYHSYTAIANLNDSSNNIVKEMKSYTVVPTANISYVLQELMLGAKKQRAAWLASGSIGYNATTSAVEFGVGPSFSWRAFELSGMVDFGRDTKLTGGYSVNGPIPVAFKTPPTATYWSVKAGIALTVRLPLGGGSSGSSSGGGH